MKQKPWSIVILAAFHFIAPLGNILLSSYVNSVGIVPNIMDRFKIENLSDTFTFLLLPPMAGFFIFICKRWSYYLYLVTMAGILGSVTYFWIQVSDLLSIWPLVFIFIINIGVVAYFMIPAVRLVYFDPRLRWWESRPRYYFEKDAQLIVGEKRLSAHITNISESGAFVTLSEPVSDEARAILSFENDGVNFEISSALAVHSEVRDNGVGIQFQATDAARSELKALVEKLNSEGKVIASRRPTDEDAFQYWAKQVLSLKGGLIPKK